MTNDNTCPSPSPPIVHLPTQAKRLHQQIQRTGAEMYIPPPPQTYPPSSDELVSPLSGLPTDLWLHILDLFNKKELIRLTFVSKQWRRFIQNPNLWMQLDFTEFCRQGNYYHRYLRWIHLVKKPQFVKLNSLKLYPHMYVGPRYFKELAHHCPKLEELEVSRPEPLKLIDLWDIGRYLTSLKSLSIPEIPTSVDSEDYVETDQPRCTLTMENVLQEFEHKKVENLLLGQYRPFLDNSMLQVLAQRFPNLRNLCLVNGTGDSDYLRQLNQDVSAGFITLLKELRQLESICLARVIIDDDGWRQLLPLLQNLQRVDMHHVSDIPTFVIEAMVSKSFRQTSIYLMNCQGRELELDLVPDLAPRAPNFVALQYPTVPFSSQPRNMDQFLSGSLPPRRIDEPDYETDEEMNNNVDTDDGSEY